LLEPRRELRRLREPIARVGDDTSDGAIDCLDASDEDDALAREPDRVTEVPACRVSDDRVAE
jgi:hypothetical protein